MGLTEELMNEFGYNQRFAGKGVDLILTAWVSNSAPYEYLVLDWDNVISKFGFGNTPKGNVGYFSNVIENFLERYADGF